MLRWHHNTFCRYTMQSWNINVDSMKLPDLSVTLLHYNSSLTKWEKQQNWRSLCISCSQHNLLCSAVCSVQCAVCTGRTLHKVTLMPPARAPLFNSHHQHFHLFLSSKTIATSPFTLLYSELNNCRNKNHTSYLSFFLHRQNFRRRKFTPKFTQ